MPTQIVMKIFSHYIFKSGKLIRWVFSTSVPAHPIVPIKTDSFLPSGHYLVGTLVLCDMHLTLSTLLRTDVMPEGGTQIWIGQGCAARASKPLPIFKGDFGRKGYLFLRFFSWKIGPFFKNFTIFAMRKPKNLGSVRKVDPCLRIFW